MAFPFTPNKQSKSRHFYDIRTDLPNFETLEDAKKESQIRQKALIKGGYHDLAEKLADCAQDYRCESPACPRCVRHNRRGFYDAAAALSKQHDRANQRTVTLIYYSEAMTNEELESFDPNRLTERVRKQLTRSGFQNPVIGGLELDYHEDIDLWIPHFHLLVTNDIEPLEILREKYFRKEKRPTSKGTHTTPTSRPMMVQRLKRPPKQLSYLCKQRWQSISAYIAIVTGKRRTDKHRLETYKFILSLIVLDSYTFSDLMILYKVRVVNNEFKVSPSVYELKGKNP
ncbi:hypothetical protein [Nitrosomonas sp.]|uniref:hypothetical protein n=1 Tax=Nitrosomonas sp. TaxID=42353 RepID=UPI001D98C32A|nr:hypothetical protein [Nitrosomonas sp.]MBX3617242.1 hypothetical protein [Nitrosomonas sp.]